MIMELFPALSLSWLNGWIALVLLVLVDGFLFLIFPKPVVKRLWDRSGWSPEQTVFTVLGKLVALGGLILIVFTPLKTGTPFFYLGSALVLAALAGLAKALFDFRNTPLDQPVSLGMYKISRHPQIVMSALVLLGASVAIGSWTAVILWVISRLLSHAGILAEEEICLKQYGESYRQYLQRVPRYFIFF
jgi:protein-S-isoprenylcysteine O-methyltransferase Ste14